MSRGPRAASRLAGDNRSSRPKGDALDNAPRVSSRDSLAVEHAVMLGPQALAHGAPHGRQEHAPGHLATVTAPTAHGAPATSRTRAISVRAASIVRVPRSAATATPSEPQAIAGAPTWPRRDRHA